MDPNLDFELYMAVWLDLTHGKCSNGHFKMLVVGKSDFVVDKT